MRATLPIVLLCACGGSEVPVERVTGALTWTIGIDGSGVEGCSYTRTYDGLTDVSAPWLCPDCTSHWRAEVDLDREGRDCYERLFGRGPDAVEWLGFDGTEVRRGPRNFQLGSIGASAWAGDRLPVLFTQALTGAEFPVQGGDPEDRITLVVEGELERSPGKGDPWHGFEPPETYACGWPHEEAEDYDGDWTLRVGETLPDGYFVDGCGESVRLHHLAGRYLVLDVSAVDCPPCQIMADEADQFHDDMAAAGVEAATVTLLAPTLSAVLDPTPRRTLNEWSDTFALTDPVVSDRGWGVWVAGGFIGPAFAYPSWVVVAPDLEVVAVGNGYGGWGIVADEVRRHAGR